MLQYVPNSINIQLNNPPPSIKFCDYTFGATSDMIACVELYKQ